MSGRKSVRGGPTSRTQHVIEQTPDGTWGVRLAFSAVKGIHTDEVQRLAAGQPYVSLQDLWHRARPSRPTAQHLAEIGALEPVRGNLTRRDLLLQIAELHHQAHARHDEGQLPLDDQLLAAEPSGLPEMTGRDVMNAELTVLGIDVSQHLMDHHHRLLRELGASDAAHLHALRPGQRVLVAGVRASTQTPPIRSGRRIIFVTLEDGSGMVDLAFFDNTHEACAHTTFHSGLLLVRGTVQRRGPCNAVTGDMAWDLDAIARARGDHGPEAALRLLGETRPHPTPAQPQRTIPIGTGGAQLHPWADLQLAGDRSANLKTLGHTSPGSPDFEVSHETPQLVTWKEVG
ncbi:hypothetical protein CK936_16945 [Streptomyces albireticuli]|uniref:Error-prone DNA polymerase n=1 Tax=Streptomyces albireticuli TaxID=1940 RepID=A0A2A2D5K9_9ACTN|nr:hypothetical protein CK936_16945 [Streptomyces albireticuli]